MIEKIRTISVTCGMTWNVPKYMYVIGLPEGKKIEKNEKIIWEKLLQFYKKH